MIMDCITKKKVLEDSIDKRRGNRKHTYRKCFAQRSGISQDGSFFNVPFLNCKKVFEDQTPLLLFKCKQPYSYGYFRRINNEHELEMIGNWENKQGGLVYLHDCLSLSIALDFNFCQDEIKGRSRTYLGELEQKAKYQQNEESIERIVEKIIETIDFISFYKEADFVCAVPPSPSKHFDLPREIVSRVSQKISKPNITDHFEFKQEKLWSAKECSLEEKWKNWEDTGVSFKEDIQGKTVLLIDDLYQSGISLQYIAMKLQDAGCKEVYGLTVVKSWSDTDNNYLL